MNRGGEGGVSQKLFAQTVGEACGINGVTANTDPSLFVAVLLF